MNHIHFDVYLTHIPTGEQIIYHDNFGHVTDEEDWKSRSIFIWEDGNYSCDCNRALFFERAKTGDDSVWVEQECGHIVYKLDKLVVRETGEIVYSETA
jgi:hypothetical protein